RRHTRFSRDWSSDVCSSDLPDAIIVVISNPMDTMTYLALKSTGLPKNRIIGMGGALDSSRFKYQLSRRLGCSPADLNAVVIGGQIGRASCRERGYVWGIGGA